MCENELHILGADLCTWGVWFGTLVTHTDLRMCSVQSDSTDTYVYLRRQEKTKN